jgi:hypothetical protein
MLYNTGEYYVDDVTVIHIGISEKNSLTTTESELSNCKQLSLLAWFCCSILPQNKLLMLKYITTENTSIMLKYITPQNTLIMLKYMTSCTCR